MANGAGILRDGDGPLRGILQHGPAERVPLCAGVDGQPAQHQDRNRVWHVAADCAGRHTVCDRPGGHSVAMNAIVLIDHYVDAAGTALLVGHRPAYELLIDNRFSARKIFNTVGGTVDQIALL